ncbi:hypothetical protein K0O23_06835 [Pontibacter aydingkolensis]|uniref:Uncharacterized protein n=2 Tax=Pontibacter aydingkolensis TaxID=1911536 RepID=A0ABS7CSE2_9BACT|nr:hypothetical protein [Pontibacter aydingkolensis]MBW7466777.1 hypothetical protein [Pontibacter aydingkolensis]
MPKGYDLFLSSRQEVKASAVETYMRSSGWVPKVEALTYKDNVEQEVENQPSRPSKKNKVTNRQKSWVPWPKA